MDTHVKKDEVVWGADGDGQYGVGAYPMPEGTPGFGVAVMHRRKNSGKMHPVKGAVLSRPDLVKLRDRINALLKAS